MAVHDQNGLRLTIVQGPFIIEIINAQSVVTLLVLLEAVVHVKICCANGRLGPGNS